MYGRRSVQGGAPERLADMPVNGFGLALLQLRVEVDDSWANYFVIVLYFAFTLGIGFALRTKQKSSEDFFLSGRSLPSWVTGLAFLGANLGALEVMGMGATAAQYGIMQAHFYWVGAIPAMIFVAIFMMPFYYGSRVHSVPGYLKLRYNEAARGFNAISFAVMTVLMSGINMFAMALIFNLLLGWSITWSIWLSAGIILTYIVLGGLSAAIYNETLQFFFLILGLIPITYLALRDVGGWSGLQERLSDRPEYFHLWTYTAGTDNPMSVSWIGIALGLGFVLSFGYWCTDFLVIQRALAAEDEAAAERTPLIAAFPKLLFPFLIFVPALVIITVLPGLGQGGGTENSYNMAIPYAMANYLPSGILGLALTGLLAAFMSGMAGNVTAFNTVWTYDIYHSYINRNASDRHYLNMGRIITVVGVLLSVATAYIAMGFASITDYVQLLFSFFNAPLFATFLLGMFWTRATPWGGFAGLVAGTLSAIGLYGLELLGVLSYGSPLAGTLWRALWAWVICFGVTILVSLVTRPKPEEELEGLVYGLTEKKQAVERVWYKKPWVLAGAAFAVLVFLNIYFF
jgi:solute:Na+ symporter, SSS family